MKKTTEKKLKTQIEWNGPTQSEQVCKTWERCVRTHLTMIWRSESASFTDEGIAKALKDCCSQGKGDNVRQAESAH